MIHKHSHISLSLWYYWKEWEAEWQYRLVVRVRVVLCVLACLDWSRIPGERSRAWWEGEGAETSWAEPVVIHAYPNLVLPEGSHSTTLTSSFSILSFLHGFVFLPRHCERTITRSCMCVFTWVGTFDRTWQNCRWLLSSQKFSFSRL